MDEKTSPRKRPAERPPAAPPAAGADVRASDADRDRVLEILREALAEGRLDAGEHAERIDAACRAGTVGELRPLVRDLPDGRETAARSGRPASGGCGDDVIAVFGGASRKGRRRAGARTNAFALFGGVEIDLTEALFERRELVVNATAVFGGIKIKVPENVTLRGSGSGILGGYDVEARESADPDAPVVVVRGAAVFGGVEAKAERGKRLRNLRR
ncbi:DUF1707 domain-containing protein [Streptomyces sp. CNQ085]|uniref:DUF1707 SHOCT-like domain-containing protein n=1 Tax=Streptomyces sp. CNQ085 TaxID=2886944 RepID=UPI001F50ABBE|nr:DUF1707 domain-containing protein [Streptomyces sp. CNQ085]MCI0383850.1 DUF1707 domain-containing protein [Streptomyces sp. CNQ085]